MWRVAHHEPSHGNAYLSDRRTIAYNLAKPASSARQPACVKFIRLWYLVPHDELVRMAEINTPWLGSPPWHVDG